MREVWKKNEFRVLTPEEDRQRQEEWQREWKKRQDEWEQKK